MAEFDKDVWIGREDVALSCDWSTKGWRELEEYIATKVKAKIG
jgi:hypothetical protein